MMMMMPVNITWISDRHCSQLQKKATVQTYTPVIHSYPFTKSWHNATFYIKHVQRQHWWQPFLTGNDII